MNAYVNYLKNNWLKQNTEQLDLVRRNDEYQVFRGPGPLLTLQGHAFIHDSERMARLIISDLMFMEGKSEEPFSAPWLYAFQKDVFEGQADVLAHGLERQLSSDPVVAMKTMGQYNFRRFNPDERLFPFSFFSLSSLISQINEYQNAMMSEIIAEETELHPFLQMLRLSYERLTIPRKVVLLALSGCHDSGIVLPLMLVSGRVSPVEYAKALVALKIAEEDHFQGMLSGLLHAIDYLECSDRKSTSLLQASRVIREGEGDLAEFKSTLRWDIRAGKNNPSVERASLKTIAAFLNSAGGILLIGVRDDGSVEGIESDKFLNEDKFLLHLWTLIRTWLGREVSPYIRTTLEKIDEKTVCQVECRRSNRPVFLRQPGADEAFYIRVGPSSNAMNISEALTYIADHFPG
ncbi:MAG: ATP-binding protein [Bacteroidota bacterium]